MENKGLIDKIVNKIDKSMGLSNVKRNIEDNKLYFEYKEIEYRLRMPNYKERKIIDKFKGARYLELVGTTPCKDKLIADLELSGKSVKKIRDQISDLDIDKGKLQEFLAKEAKPDAKHENKEAIEKLIADIRVVVYKQVTLLNEEFQLLSPCIENQIKDVELEGIILNLFDKKVDEKWIKVYNNKEELNNEEDSELLDNAVQLSADLGVYNI